jgi:hypothetical protein
METAPSVTDKNITVIPFFEGETIRLGRTIMIDGAQAPAFECRGLGGRTYDISE